MGGRSNKYAHLGEPEDVLDFHELGRVSSGDVKRETLAFVQDARKRGLKRIRIVTGKGNRSAGKPVVKPQVERTLRRLEQDGEIDAYRAEQLTAGGDGAFFVKL